MVLKKEIHPTPKIRRMLCLSCIIIIIILGKKGKMKRLVFLSYWWSGGNKKNKLIIVSMLVIRHRVSELISKAREGSFSCFVSTDVYGNLDGVF